MVIEESDINSLFENILSHIPCRNTVSKVYPAMCIENFTELAFDDVTPEDPDFPSIQGDDSKRYFLLETMLLWPSF